MSGKDLELDPWLLANARSEKDAIVVQGLADNLPLWRIGELANYSAGHASSEAGRRKNWSATVSRASRSERIQTLLAEYQEYRLNGTHDIAASDEVLRHLTQLSRTGSGNTRLAALKYLADYHRKHEGNGDSFMRETSARRLIDESLRRENTWLHGVALAYARELLLWGDREMQDWRPPEKFERAYALLDAWGGAWIDVAEVLHAGGATNIKESQTGAGARSDDRAAATSQPDARSGPGHSDLVELQAAGNAQ